MFRIVKWHLFNNLNKAVKKLLRYLVAELLLFFPHETKCRTKTIFGSQYLYTVQFFGVNGASFETPDCAHITRQTVFSPIQSSPFTSSLKTHKLRTQCQRLALWTEADLTVHYCYRHTGIKQRETHEAALGGKVLTCISCLSGKEIRHCSLSNFTGFVLKFTIPSFIHILGQTHSLWNIFLNKKLSSEGHWEVRVKYFNYSSLFRDWTSQ